MSFEKGEVVWAKIKGFPWWPGVVKLSFVKHEIKKYYVGF
jgi:hypothetical protein